VVQTDIKKVLAYSTCSQLGYMVAALGTGSLMGGYFHLTTHAFFKALLFLAAGSMIHAVHSNELSAMGGLWRRMRVTSLVFIVGALALAGLPGLSGFFSKDLILEELLEAGLWGPFGAAMAAAFLTAFYMTRVVFLALFGPAGPGTDKAHESPAVMTIPMGILALLALGAGYFGDAFAELYRTEYHFHLSGPGIAASFLGVAGIGLGYVLYGSRTLAGSSLGFLEPIGRFIRYGAVDRAATWGFHRVLLVGARGVAWFDRYIIDGFMNAVGWAFMAAASAMRPLQSGRVGDYLYALVVGLILLTAAGWMIHS